MRNPLQKRRSSLVLGVVAGLAMVGWSMSSHAQECTITNWQGGAVGGDLLTPDTPRQGNSRYAGPCSLAVDLANAPAFVVDDSPLAEQQYIARFYFNPNGNASADRPMIIFAANSEADGTGSDVVQLWYNVASASPFQTQPNHVTLVIQTETGPAQILAGATGVRANGWNSFEIVWGAAANADITLNVNGAADQVLAGVDTSTQRIRSALLGLVGYPDGTTMTSGAPMFFDDFDSRRQTRPGRLCRGLTDESRTALAPDDVQNIFLEALTGGNVLAGGQPDFNEDGVVGPTDVQDVFVRILTGNADCSVNL
jgi:hypothetical protein